MVAHEVAVLGCPVISLVKGYYLSPISAGVKIIVEHQAYVVARVSNALTYDFSVF